MYKCVLCSENHKEIYQNFTEYFVAEKIEKNHCQKFIDDIKSQILIENWLGVYCLVKNIVKQDTYYTQTNIFSNIIWKICLLLEEIMRKDPTQKSLKMIETVNFFINGIEPENMAKRVFSKQPMSIKEIDDERKRIIDIIIAAEKLKQNPEIPNEVSIPDIEDQLKNYAILRIIALYERVVYEIIKKEVNKISPEYLEIILGEQTTLSTNELINLKNIDFGKIAAQQIDNSPKKLNFIFIDILKAKYAKDNFQPDKKLSFWKIFNEIVILKHETTKKYLETQGGWFKFIRKINSINNKLKHELSNSNLELNEIKYIITLYDIFIKNFSYVLELIINFKDKNYTKKLYQKRRAMLSPNLYDLMPLEKSLQRINSEIILRRRNN